MYAIMESGGKQYKVQPGDIIYVEKLNKQTGETVAFKVLMLSLDGETPMIGAPYVESASVSAKVLGDVKGKKITVVKYKSKKNYRRKQGHRQPYTRIEITGVS